MIRFLVDASLPRGVVDVIRTFGHEAIDVRDIGLGDAPDSVIAGHARSDALCLLTRDVDFTDIRVYPPSHYHGIVLVSAQVPANRDAVLRLLSAFLRAIPQLGEVAGALIVVEPGRIRLRVG